MGLSKKRRMIYLCGIRCLVVDLSEPLSLDREVYPGDPKPKKRVFSSFASSGCEHHIYCLSDHIFHPHGDAPKHQNKGGSGFECYNLDFCFNDACLVDLSNCKEAEVLNGIKYLVRIEEKHIKPYTALISKKGALIIRTGYDKWLETNKHHKKGKIPYLTEEACDILVKFDKLKVICIDSLSIDAPGSSYVHKRFKNKLIVESLVNLYSIPKQDRRSFCLQTSPVQIIGATGGPVKAYAFIRKG